MLNYYLRAYKNKFEEQIKKREGQFFTEIADKVVNELKIYS